MSNHNIQNNRLSINILYLKIMEKFLKRKWESLEKVWRWVWWIFQAVDWEKNIFLKTYFWRLKMLKTGRIKTLLYLFGSFGNQIARCDCVYSLCPQNFTDCTLTNSKIQWNSFSFYILIFLNYHLEIIYRCPSIVSKANMTTLGFF